MNQSICPRSRSTMPAPGLEEIDGVVITHREAVERLVKAQDAVREALRELDAAKLNLAALEGK